MTGPKDFETVAYIKPDLLRGFANQDLESVRLALRSFLNQSGQCGNKDLRIAMKLLPLTPLASCPPLKGCDQVLAVAGPHWPGGLSSLHRLAHCAWAQTENCQADDPDSYGPADFLPLWRQTLLLSFTSELLARAMAPSQSGQAHLANQAWLCGLLTGICGILVAFPTQGDSHRPGSKRSRSGRLRVTVRDLAILTEAFQLGSAFDLPGTTSPNTGPWNICSAATRLLCELNVADDWLVQMMSYIPAADWNPGLRPALQRRLAEIEHKCVALNSAIWSIAP